MASTKAYAIDEKSLSSHMSLETGTESKTGAADSQVNPHSNTTSATDTQNTNAPTDTQNNNSTTDTCTSIFKEVESILPLSCGHKKRRYPVTVEEVKRRVGPPENMSLNSLVAYLRVDKTKNVTLKQDLQDAGIDPAPKTSVTSLCSRVTEGEAADLTLSIGKLAVSTIPFDDITIVALDHQYPDISIGRLYEFREMLQSLVTAVKAHSGDFDLATHGMGFGLLDVYTGILMQVTEKEIENRKKK
ncbi:transcription factor AP-2-delta-like isoform X1 [Myxocyprinus asiaticus]|uniref:transcription factor AP-2-delta-like isoform X1 n=1 Tax=Myxocyprinus asiaticus TaxID=70543 RepID=UPI002222707C|nr:transcription factor AP-2-delta-like isoform X1 [Myxocyprinus asiaticus]